MVNTPMFIVLQQLGSQVRHAAANDDLIDVWKRPQGLEHVQMAWNADYTKYTAFQDVEPYANEHEELQVPSLDGEDFLVRRHGPGPKDFDVSAACWTRKRNPKICCFKQDNHHCRLPPEYAERCCSSFKQDGEFTQWFQLYIMFSEDLVWDDRLLWDAFIPKTIIDEQVFTLKRLRWRIGDQEPWDLCPSTIVKAHQDEEHSFQFPESNTAVMSLVHMLDMAGILSRSFVNVGAGTCGVGDPLNGLLHSPSGKGFAGLLIDANASDLSLCQQNLEGHTVSWYRLLHMAAMPKTIASRLQPHLRDMFRGIDDDIRKYPLDLLVIDIDGCDCVVAEELLQLVEPKILVIEMAFHFPPPFRFSAQHDDANSAHWLEEFDVTLFNPGAGCSLSHALHLFKPYGFHLLRLVDQDAIFIHKSVAPIFANGLGVRFPQDEFLCYRRSRLQVQLPMHFVREWFFAEHPADSLGNIWRNVTQFQRSQGRSDTPFSLDY